MKLTFGSLFGSPAKPGKKAKPARTISRSETSSFGSHSSEEESTPKSVLPREKVTRRELEGVLRKLGPDPPSEEEVAAMLAEAEHGGEGGISLEAIGALGGSARRSTAGIELRGAFAVFDEDGDGRISAEELMKMFAMIGEESCTIDDCRRMIGGVDSDGDGFVCFDDFVRMMSSPR
ncbi:putative EF-hand domain-containing protein [Dioscorea sansibarensis]